MPVVGFTGLIDPSCNGDSTGQVTATGGGTYLWSNGQTSATATGLWNGNFLVTVTSNVGCQTIADTTIVDPPQLTANVSVGNLNCHGDNSGSALVTITQASTSPFDYEWSTLSSTIDTIGLTNTETGLAAGNYDVTITDANNCEQILNFTITQPTPWDVSYTVTDATCGASNGTIDLTVNGGNTLPYTYSWSPSPAVSGQEDQTGLSANSYTVTITDSNTPSCDTNFVISISNTGAPVIAIDSSNNPTCFDGTNGVAYASLTTTSTGPYTYVWSAGTSTPVGASALTNTSTTGLSAGVIYTVTVTDANNCESSEQITLTQPNLMVITEDLVVDENCGLSDGTIDISTVGGTGAYTYIWSPAPAVSGQEDQTGLSAATYMVIATDINSCDDTLDIIVSNIPGPQISIIDTTSISCNGVCDGEAMILITAPSLAPYIYNWSNSNTTAGTTNLSDTATALCGATEYFVTLTDANNCTVIDSVTLIEPSPVIASITAFTNDSCYNDNTGTATVTGSGGTVAVDYTYLWSNGNTVSTATGLLATTYMVTIYDDNLCEATTSVTITEPAQLLASTTSVPATCGLANGTATTVGSGGTGAYQYLWDNGQITATATGLTYGSYSVTITDVNLCTVVDNILVDSIAGGTATIAPFTDVTCFGYSDGSATVSMGGGTAPFTYAWSSSGGTAITESNLGPGQVIVVVTDSTGCTATDTVTIVEPTALSLNIPNDNLKCFGDCNGVLEATVTGGTSVYTYQWDDPMLSTLDSAVNLCVGTYNLTVVDANGCTILGQANIVEPLAITETAVIVDAQCGNAIGSIDLTVAGGGGLYTYLWSNGPTTEDISGLPAATYTVTITDNKSCELIESYVVNDLGSPSAMIDTSGNVSCFGTANGLATVIATGGTGVGTYTYLWDDPLAQNTATAVNLNGGTYNVLITDTNGCSVTATVLITEPTALTYNLFTINNLCYNDSLGQASVVPIGGVSPYTYQWIGGGINPNDSLNTGMPSGTYNLVITDANGCDTINNNIIISEPLFISLTVDTVIDPSCYGYSDGSATVDVTGGTVVGNYLYQWDAAAGNQTTQTATGLGVGTYWVTVTDDNSCWEALSVTLAEPIPFVFNSVGNTNLSCYMSGDGAITSGALGGTPGYTYSWTNSVPPLTWSSTNQNLIGLEQATYYLTITDANNCHIDTSIILTQPMQLNISLVHLDENCANACDGSITSTITGGTPVNGPHTYTWNMNGGFYSSTQSLTNLCPGTYDLTVTDVNNCTATASQIITGPTALAITVNSTTDASCGSNNGAISIGFSGGTGVPSLLWSNGSTSSNLTNITAGNYCVTVTDNNLCTVDTCVGISNIGGPIINGFTVVDVTCAGSSNGSLLVDTSHAVSAATPYTIEWSNGTIGPNTIIGLPGGNYSVTVTDALGCFSVDNTSVFEPTAVGSNVGNIVNVTCNGSCTGQAEVTGGGGTPTYTYLWSNGDVTPVASNLCAGTASVTVTDANGCFVTNTAVITEPAPLVINLDYLNNATCNGLSDGSIGIIVNGGSGQYNYTWLGTGSTSSTVGGLAANTYTVVVNDQNDPSCFTSVDYTIIEPTLITATTTIEPTTCGNPNGSAEITNVTGGTPGYTYVWSPCTGGSCTGNTITNIGSGQYQVQVFDTNGCDAIFTANVGDIPPPQIFDQQSSDALCNGGNDGSAKVIMGDGTPPFTYNWSPYGSGSMATSLMAGTYTVTITDANGCESYTTFSVGEPEPVTVYADGPATPICIGMWTNLTATAAGGTSPYTYNWDSGLGTSQLQTVSPTNTTTYMVAAEDANGCLSGLTPVTVEVYPGITVSLSPDVNICETDTHEITASAYGGNGGPYTYIWNLGSGNPNVVMPTTATEYIVSAIDGCGSPSDEDTMTVSVKPAPQLLSELNGFEGCQPLSVEFEGGIHPIDGEVTYEWNFGDVYSGNNNTSGDTLVSHTYENAGAYTIGLTLTSQYQCSRTYNYSNLVKVYEIPEADFKGTPEIVGLFDAEIDFQDYSESANAISFWSWNFGDNTSATTQNPNHIYELAGTYDVQLIVTTIYGCVDTTEHTIKVNEEHTFYAPEAFTPGGGLGNQHFYPKGIGIDKGMYLLTIYDRWGQIVYQSKEYPLGTDLIQEEEGGWNGKFRNTGKYVEPGAYVWRVDITDVNGVPHEYIGNVVVIR